MRAATTMMTLVNPPPHPPTSPKLSFTHTVLPPDPFVHESTWPTLLTAGLSNAWMWFGQDTQRVRPHCVPASAMFRVWGVL